MKLNRKSLLSAAELARDCTVQPPTFLKPFQVMIEENPMGAIDNDLLPQQLCYETPPMIKLFKQLKSLEL